MLTPWYHGYQREVWQRRLSENLGVNVKVDSIRFPSPNQFLVTGLVCSNPETKQEILKVARAKVDIDRSGWSIDLNSPVLNKDELQSTMDLIHNWFLCRPQRTASLLAITLKELTIDNGAYPLKLQDVKVALMPKENNSTLIVKFSLEGQRTSQQACFRIDRDHINESTHWQMESNDLAIPCNLLSERFSSLSCLGPQSSFRGTIEWWQKKQNWTTYFQGDAYSVDLGLASGPLQNPLIGIGDIHINEAMIVDGDISRLDGSLRSPKCLFDTAWLDRASESLKLQTGNEITAWSKLGLNVEASDLRIRFGWTSDGLVFAGEPKMHFAAYVGPQREVVAYLYKTLAEKVVVSNALAAYAKPTTPRPNRIARNPQ